MSSRRDTHSIHLVKASAPYSEFSPYRKHTRALLRRYFRVSLDVGRLPSILGSSMFRARVTSYKLHSFEDVVIFVHDVERCLERLDPPAVKMIAAIVFLELTREEASRLFALSPAQTDRRFVAAIDRLSSILIETGLMRPVFEQAEEEPKRMPASKVPAESEPVPRKPPASVKPVSHGKVLCFQR